MKGSGFLQRLFTRLQAGAQFGGQAGQVPLVTPGNGQGIGRDRAGNCGSRADGCARSNRYRRNQGTVGADKGLRPAHGLMLQVSIIVAGNGASPDIGAFANSGIADIAEMVRLGPCRECRILDLDKIADPRLFADIRTRAQPRIGADHRAPSNDTAFHMTESLNRHIALDHNLGAKDDILTDGDILSQHGIPGK